MEKEKEPGVDRDSSDDEVNDVEEVVGNGGEVGDEDLVNKKVVDDDDADPDYDPDKDLPRQKRSSNRLKAKDRCDYNFYRKTRDPERVSQEKEKQAFIAAIKKYGTKDWKNVAKCVPTKLDTIIKGWIVRQKRNQLYTMERRRRKPDGTLGAVLNSGLDKMKTAKGETLTGPSSVDSILNEETLEDLGEEKIEETIIRKESLTPIDKWVEIIEKKVEADNQKKKEQGDLSRPLSCSKILPMSFQWLAEFEQHPSLEETGGVDYAAIYRYFGHLSEGEVPADLDPITAARVTRLITDLATLVKDTPLEKETHYLGSYTGIHTRYKISESFNAETRDAKLIGDLGRLPGINPLNFPTEMCLGKQLDPKRLAVVVNKTTSSATTAESAQL